MTHQASSPPLIKGNDGIVSRTPNEVNYSILNGKVMEKGNQPGKKIRQKYKKYGLKKMEKYYVNREENAGKIENWMEPGDENEIETMKKDIGSDGEEVGQTEDPQQQKGEKSEAKATGENSNSSNTAVTLQLLEEQVQKIKALGTRTRAATAEALNGNRMETGKHLENEIGRKYKKYGLKKMKKYLKEEENAGKIKIGWNQAIKTKSN